MHIIGDGACLEVELVGSLEGEHFAHIIRGCNLVTKFFNQPAHFPDLFSIGCCQFPALDK